MIENRESLRNYFKRRDGNWEKRGRNWKSREMETEKQKAELQAKKLRNGRGFDENLQNTGDQEMGAKQLLELRI